MDSTTSFDTNIPTQTNLYHYTPLKGLCYFFVVLFCLSTAVHVFFAIRYRLWWIFPTIILAGVGEIVGWIARAASSNDPTNRNDYIIQSTTLVLAPTPLLASVFIIFGRLTEKIGPSYGRLSPRLYSRIFLTCDIVALLIQGSGGGIAASANNLSSQKLGGNIMLVGIIFQTIAMVVFVLLAAGYFYRYANDRPARPDTNYYSPSQSTAKALLNKNLKLMTIGVYFSMFFLLIRGFYRVVELADGWDGKIATTQWLFTVFDGAMIALTMYTLNALHPGPLLSGPSQGSLSEADKSLSSYRQTESLEMGAV